MNVETNLPRLDRRYRAAAHVLAQSSGDEVVLLDLRTEQYFGLDAVGGELWTALEVGRTPDEVAETVCRSYRVTPEVVRADMAELLAALLDAELLVACDG